jgi:transmembrane sensor
MSEPKFRHLPPRFSDAIETPIAEERVHASWKETQLRMRRPVVRTPFLIGMAGALAIAAAIALFLVPRGRGEEPLRLSDGSLPVATDRETTLRFEDGSWIALSRDARITPRENTARAFTVELEGHAHFDVTPGNARRWRIVAGDVSVEVVGTSFDVDNQRDHARVDVSRGVVRVRRNDETHVLRAGQSMTLDRSTPVVTAEAPPEEIEPVRDEEPDPAPRRPARRSSWQSLASAGEYDQAYEAFETTRVRPDSLGPEDLMMLADVARLSGHPRDAVAPLERLLAVYPRDSHAALAAILLGRVEMDRLHRPDRARRAFERATELGVPEALRRDVESRLTRLREMERTP